MPNRRSWVKNPYLFVEEDIEDYTSGKIGAIKVAKDIYSRLSIEMLRGYNVLCVLQDMNLEEIDTLARFINKCQDGRGAKNA